MSGLRFGVSLGYWPWVTFDEQVRLAMLADELGLDSVWSAEAWGQDAVSLLGYLAARTERVALGTMIMHIPARKPTATAMAAVSIDVLSGGRMRLGLGLSGPQVSEGWYGVPYGRPLARTREYVTLVRRALAGEPLTVPLENDGAGSTGLARPIKLLAEPVQDRIPIYLGANGPKAIEQAGQIADGWVPAMLNPDMPEVLLDPLRAGAGSAGRSVDDIDILVGTFVAIDDDVDRARDLIRPIVGWYLGGMGALKKNFYVDLADAYGHGDAARDVQRRFLSGDRKGAEAAVPDAFIDAIAIATTPRGLEERLAKFEGLGVNGLMLFPFGDKEAVLRTVAQVAV